MIFLPGKPLGSVSNVAVGKIFTRSSSQLLKMSGLRDTLGSEVCCDTEPVSQGARSNHSGTRDGWISTPHALWMVGPWVIGIALGVLLPPSKSLPPPIDTVSAIIGWVYFSAWSISFYPQCRYTKFQGELSIFFNEYLIINLWGKKLFDKGFLLNMFSAQQFHSKERCWTELGFSTH